MIDRSVCTKKESLFAFASVAYERLDRKLLVVKTRTDSYRLESLDDRTSVYYNDVLLGEIDPSDQFWDSQNKLILKLTTDSLRDYHTLYMHDRCNR